MSETIFTDAREALDSLANDAASTASDQGLDTVRDLADDVRKALDAGLRYRAALDGITALRREGRYNSAPECRKIAEEALDA